MVEVLGLPLLACLVLAIIHAYLGLHILARGVIFVDLALAQVAALGMTVAFLAGHALGSAAGYWYALTFAIAGGLAFAMTRMRRPAVPQEAVIGIVYAVSAAVAVLAVDRAPQGAEHVKQLLVGSLLTVGVTDVARLAALYAAVGVVHWLARGPLLEISLAPDAALARRRPVRAWDAAFYVSFAVVVTSSVRVAGVLLVFAYLVIPAVVGALIARSVAGRLAVGWAIATLASAVGLAVSYVADLPAGASVVAVLGVAVALTAATLAAARLAQRVRARGVAALRPLAAVAGGAIALAGALLMLVPRMDHHWLDWLEAAVPAVQETFLTDAERATRRDSVRAVAAARAQLAEMRALQQDAQWGVRPLEPDRAERLRQFLAARAEIAAGDRVVLQTLRARARERQRWWLGAPLTALGAAAAILMIRRRPRAASGVPATYDV